MASIPTTYRAAVLEAPGAALHLRDLNIKHPGPGEVLVKVLACGVCRSDWAVQAQYLGPLPRVPGHELIGEVVEIGIDVSRVKVGQQVGAGWHGGHDGVCQACEHGYFQMCKKGVINGGSVDGGYAEYVLLREEATVRIPAGLDPAEAAPLLCAGVTVFNGIRKLNVETGGLVAVQGLGGLGHLAVQYANHMGYKVVAISSGGSKRDLAMKLGAKAYVDSAEEDASKKLQNMGGATIIIATAPNPKAVSSLVPGLGLRGKLLILSGVGNVEISTSILSRYGASVHGWPSGHATDCEDAIDFAQTHGIRCMVERYSLDQAQSAFEHMLSSKARFRAVIVMDKEGMQTADR
ncbi:alcohol dehydrogenase GroES-like domain-containing protein [Dactylonectria macrodidyma]|uniref:Alcohol dehydrogenase GroES-like domain-containing protein n=1 Tax=Dactylonectria macrodidyma TaxID=307937 RepID=A0A9P9ER95_9HYPO|nr:alcohol dehydrogenase GroES-like domain-containing protein [Dactylonectria macrodidyma]